MQQLIAAEQGHRNAELRLSEVASAVEYSYRHDPYNTTGEHPRRRWHPVRRLDQSGRSYNHVPNSTPPGHTVVTVTLGQVSHIAMRDQVCSLLLELGFAMGTDILAVRKGPGRQGPDEGLWFVDIAPHAEARLTALHRRVHWSFDAVSAVDLGRVCGWEPVHGDGSKPPSVVGMVKAPMTVERSRIQPTPVRRTQSVQHR